MVEGDLTDSSLLNHLFSENKDISAVVHFAALKAVGESTEYPLKYYHNNVSGSICLLQAMESAGVHQLVFSSSCTVYGEPSTVLLDESHPVGGVSSPYGRTKFQMEEIVNDHSFAKPNFKAGVLRYFNPVGAHPSGEIGEDPNGIPDNLVPFVCQGGHWTDTKHSGFLVAIIQLGTVPRCGTICMWSIWRMHLKALEALSKRDAGFTCNLGTGKGSSVLEVIAAFEKATGKKIPHEIVGRRVGDVTEAWADPSLAEKLLGWKTVRSLDEMLGDAWHWQSKNPNGYRSGNYNP